VSIYAAIPLSEKTNPKSQMTNGRQLMQSTHQVCWPLVTAKLKN